MTINAEIIFHLLEMLVLGAPLWYGAIRLAVILREFPPHVHEEGNMIRYPIGYTPGRTQKMNGK